MDHEAMSAMLEARGIAKAFPGVRALDGVNLQVDRGEVHALLGENGAGKSTLLKILSGAQQPDAGEILLNGVSLDVAQTPLERQQAGIVTIYQEFNLLPDISVAENMYVGREPVRYGLIDWSTLHRQAAGILAILGLQIDPRAAVRTLTVGEQQMVEIARAMTFEARLIIMDEPTAALSSREVDTLHRIVRELRGRGVSIIYVTHRLNEVSTLCDRFTVLRDGRYIADGRVCEHSTDDLIRLMVGRNVDLLRHRRHRPPSDEALRVEGVSSDPGKRARTTSLKDICMRVQSGEILGLAGLMGAGRTDFARILFGADSCTAGTLWLSRDRIHMPRSPAEAIHHGISLLPEHRKRDGCFLDQSIRQNMTLPSLKQLTRWKLFVSDRRAMQFVEKYRRALGIAMSSDLTPIGHLSGGNQQKVLLARCLALAPKVLILDEPTRGIDVGAKAEVHELIRQTADSGVALIVISSELLELLAISDRIGVFREGQLVAEVDGETATEQRVMSLMAMGAAA
jgi:inositol transport system ATP-binding protein